jgi:CubicO group peptidase (beta-lactamase class C family)
MVKSVCNRDIRYLTSVDLRKGWTMKRKALSTAATFIILVVASFFGGCSSFEVPIPNESPQDAYAIDNLPLAPSNSLDEEILARLVAQIRLGAFGKIHSLIIIHNDSVVLEEYFRGWTRDMLHPCFSATKSVTSALIGIAIAQGQIDDVDENLLSFFPEYAAIANLDERKESITLEHVLTMSAGFTWDEIFVPYLDSSGEPNPENSAVKMYLSDDRVKHVLDLPMSDDPGSRFVYSTGCTTLLSGILTNTTGQSAEDFAEENLFTALGITDWEWSAGPDELSDTGAGLELHPVDMAMFGYLYLHSGLFNGEQIVPADWVAESSAKHIAFKEPNSGEDLSDYGYQWWRFTDNSVEGSVEINDIFYASGYGGQFVFIIPHLNMVVASTAANFEYYRMTGLMPASRMLFGYIIPAVPEQ